MKRIKRFIPILLLGWILTACSSDTPETSIELDFESIETNINIQSVQSTYEVIKERSIYGYKAIMYKMDKDGDIHGGVFMNSVLYSIGVVSMNSSSDDVLLITESNVFGKKLIRFSGVLGANYARAVYVEVVDDVVSPLLEVEGNIVERDLDNDSVNEIITSIGTISETSIYRIHNNSIGVANINKSIDAEAVNYVIEKDIFEVYFVPNKSSIYLYSNGIMHHVKPVESVIQK